MKHLEAECRYPAECCQQSPAHACSHSPVELRGGSYSNTTSRIVVWRGKHDRIVRPFVEVRAEFTCGAHGQRPELHSIGEPMAWVHTMPIRYGPVSGMRISAEVIIGDRPAPRAAADRDDLPQALDRGADGDRCVHINVDGRQVGQFRRPFTRRSRSSLRGPGRVLWAGLRSPAANHL